MFHTNCSALDLTNPFIGQHVSLREHYVVQVPKGPSMLEEKLACPMEDAAHERRFLTSQRGSSASTFPDEHVSIVARTLNMMENMFLESGARAHDRSYWRPTTPVDTAGDVHDPADLPYPGSWTAAVDVSKSDRILESDFQDSVEGDTIDDLRAEIQMLREKTRKQRKSLYRQKPAVLRVATRLSSRADVNLRSKPSDSVAIFQGPRLDFDTG